MRTSKTDLAGVIVLEPSVFEDERGFFMESWNRASFNKAVGTAIDFVQDNHSGSKKGTVRGMHYQKAPHGQGKLVRASVGAVFDVAVDLRESSPTFGNWIGVELSSANRRQLWIPVGLAHGFMTLTDWAEIQYKATAYYHPGSEGSVRWNDPAIGVQWPRGLEPILSPRDASAPSLGEVNYFP